MPLLLHFGYICACGDRVVVFTFEIGVTTVLPDQVSITCKNRHATTFAAKQYGLLDQWREDAA